MRKATGATGEARIINGYQVIDIAGKGAFGQVYVAQKGANQYAVKEIQVQSIQDEDAHSMI